MRRPAIVHAWTAARLGGSEAPEIPVADGQLGTKAGPQRPAALVSNSRYERRGGSRVQILRLRLVDQQESV